MQPCVLITAYTTKIRTKVLNINKRIILHYFATAFSSLLPSSLLAGGTEASKLLNLTSPKTDGAMQTTIRIDFPYEIIAVKGEDAFSEWERLRMLKDKWPIIVGTDENLDETIENYNLNNTPPENGNNGDTLSQITSEIIKLSNNIDFPSDWNKINNEITEEDMKQITGKWPSEPQILSSGITVNADELTDKVYDKVYIALIPTNNSWEVPAYLRYGNWNACPPAKYHVAALRKWNEKYGIELVSLINDVLEIRVKQKPTTKAEAIKLAKEMYIYCPDIVDQGIRTISNLASGLMESDWCFMWWD
jgi:hypothetical protein